MLHAPVGVSDFSELVDPTKGFFFADRTLQIKQVFDDGAKALAFHTFRRSGKSLFISMLHHFLSSQVEDIQTQGMFANLRIGEEHPEFVQQHQGQYPVITISFKDAHIDSFENALTTIRDLIRESYLTHRYLSTSDQLSEEERNEYRFYTELSNQANVTQGKVERSLKALSRLLYHHHRKKVWVLMDEYDTPLVEGYRREYLNRLMSLYKNLLGAVFKDNEYLDRGILTGILRISRESLLSELNNLKICTLLNPKGYFPYFGFTEEEVVQMLERTGLVNQMEQIREWYNGYQIGGQAFYNPWSIINCIGAQGQLMPYWVNTANDALLKNALLMAPDAAKGQFEQLATQNEPILVELSELIRFEDIERHSGALWSLLYATGYATAESIEVNGLKYKANLRIPNKEVSALYEDIFSTWLAEVFSNNQAFVLNALRQGDIATFAEYVGNYLLNYASSRNLKYESSYHNLVLGLIYGLGDSHYVFSDRLETGLGFSDLLLIPRENTRKHQAILMEFKHTRKEESSDDAAEKALSQIDELAYVSALAPYSHIQEVLKVGMAFEGKAVLWKSQLESLVPVAGLSSSSSAAASSSSTARSKRSANAVDEEDEPAAEQVISASALAATSKKARLESSSSASGMDVIPPSNQANTSTGAENQAMQASDEIDAPLLPRSRA